MDIYEFYGIYEEEDYNEDYNDEEWNEEDFVDNWDFWKTRWMQVVNEDEDEEDQDEDTKREVEFEDEIHTELKEHQIYFLGLPEDLQEKIYKLVNPLHKYMYSS
jgi:hypothetical protein